MRPDRATPVSFHAVTLTLALACAAAIPARVPAQQQQDEEARRRAMAQQVLEAAQPGPEHERLAALAGEWDIEFRYFTEPDAPPLVGKGTETTRMILGGRFLQSESVTQLGDRRSESLIIYGFDRRANRYTKVAYDSWGTYYVTAKGEYDPARNAIVAVGEETDPMSGRTERYTMITRFVDADQWVSEILFRLPDGSDFKAVEVRHTRRR